MTTILVHSLERQVHILGAHAETAHWLANLNPLSEISSTWRELSDAVDLVDADLKVHADCVDYSAPHTELPLLSENYVYDPWPGYCESGPGSRCGGKRDGRSHTLNK